MKRRLFSWGFYDDTGYTCTRVVWQCPFGLTHSFVIMRNCAHFLRHFLVSRNIFCWQTFDYCTCNWALLPTLVSLLLHRMRRHLSIECWIMSGFHLRPLSRMGYPATATLVLVDFSLWTHMASLTCTLSFLEVINFRLTFPSSSYWVW